MRASARQGRHRPVEQLAQFHLGTLEGAATLGGESAAGPIDREVEHRHGGAKRLGLPSMTGECGALQRCGNRTCRALLEDSRLEVQSVAGLSDCRRPASAACWSRFPLCVSCHGFTQVSACAAGALLPRFPRPTGPGDQRGDRNFVGNDLLADHARVRGLSSTATKISPASAASSRATRAIISATRRRRGEPTVCRMPSPKEPLHRQVNPASLKALPTCHCVNGVMCPSIS